MRKILSNIFIIMLLTCSMSLISCEAIKAQNINADSFSGMKGGTGMVGGPRIQKGPGIANEDHGISGDPGLNGNIDMHGNINADLIGKIISVDGNIITIELIEQTENKKSKNSNNEKQDMKDNENSDNNNSLNAFSRNSFEVNYTGIYKTLEVSDDVDISQETNTDIQTQNSDSKSQIKISDLKKDQIIMAWYKENSDTVEKINVMQS